MKTEALKKINLIEIVVTLLLFGLVAVALLGGMQLAGIITLPPRVSAYMGGGLIGYVFVSGFAITLLSVKLMLKKG